MSDTLDEYKNFLKASNNYEDITKWVYSFIFILHPHITPETFSTIIVNETPPTTYNTPERNNRLNVDEYIPGSKMSKYQVMHSSANKYDCLIHSLLTALSSTIFAKLHQSDKDIIADYFRRNILFELVIENRDIVPSITDEMLNEIPGEGPLDFEVIRIISIKYKINFLVKDRGAAWVFSDFNPSNPGILIYNPGQGHYESIRYEPSDAYIFSNAQMVKWETAITTSDLKNKEKCIFNNGNIIRSKENGKFYVVIDVNITDDGSRCAHIYIRIIPNDAITKAEVKKFQSFISNCIMLEKPINSREIEVLDMIQKRKSNLLKAGYKPISKLLEEGRILNILGHEDEYEFVKQVGGKKSRKMRKKGKKTMRHR